MSANGSACFWIDGRLRPREEVCIAPDDRGLLLADGLFETLRADGGAPCRFERHWMRLEAGAQALGIPLPFSASTIRMACRTLLVANGLADVPASLRITLTRGPGPRGLRPPERPRPTLLIGAHPRAPAPPPPARAILPRDLRRNEHALTSRFKTLSYLDAVLALERARCAGVEDALLLNGRGLLTGATAANLFAVVGGTLITPPIRDGALAGITRAHVLEMAVRLGIPAAERSLLIADLLAASEAFLTNSLMGIRPLVAVDGRPIGDGGIGRMTRHLARELDSGG